MHDMNHDSLLQEIEEDLARQKYEKLWKEYGPTILTIAILIVAMTAGMTGYKSFKLQESTRVSEAYITAVIEKANAPDELAVAMEKFAQDHKGTSLAVFARLKAAAYAAKVDKKDEAVRQFDLIANDKDVEEIYRQYAALLAAQALLDKGDGADVAKRLEPLMVSNCVWQYTAKEYAGYLAIRMGDKEKAKALFAELKASPAAPGSVTARAADILAWLGGGAT